MNILDRLLRILKEAPNDEVYSRRELLDKLGLTMRSGSFDYALGTIGPEFQIERMYKKHWCKFYGNPAVIQVLKEKEKYETR